MSTKLYFYYETDGSLKLACSEGDYVNTLFPSDLFPTESMYLMRQTIDAFYHGIKHMEQHVVPGVVEMPIEPPPPTPKEALAEAIENL